MPRRTQPPRRPLGPPDGATAAVRHLVQLYDQQDGEGVDWSTIADALFKAAFLVVDDMPDDERRRSMMRRVHEGSYGRLTGSSGEESASSNSDGIGSVPAPSNTTVFKSTAPRPPKVGH